MDPLGTSLARHLGSVGSGAGKSPVAAELFDEGADQDFQSKIIL